MSKAEFVDVSGQAEPLPTGQSVRTKDVRVGRASTPLPGRFQVEQSYTNFKVRKGKVIVIDLELARNAAIDTS